MSEYQHQPVTQGAEPTPATKTCSSATASLWLGVTSVFLLGPIAGIPSIILGFGAKEKIKTSRGALKGDGRAASGITLGIIGTLIFGFGICLRVLVTQPHPPTQPNEVAELATHDVPEESVINFMPIGQAVAEKEKEIVPKYRYAAADDDYQTGPVYLSSGDEEPIFIRSRNAIAESLAEARANPRRRF